MGECGCGKTYLISYLCAWLRVKLVTLDVHGGTTEQDILVYLMKRHHCCRTQSTRQCMYFLTKSTLALIWDCSMRLFCRHSIHGVSFSKSIIVLAACNPYRMRKDPIATSALPLMSASSSFPNIDNDMMTMIMMKRQSQQGK